MRWLAIWNLISPERCFHLGSVSSRSNRCDALTSNSKPASSHFEGMVEMRLKLPGALLLLAPYIGLLCVPLYNSKRPELFGFPFFYWYQFAWIPITVLLIWFAYRRMRDDE
jgi:Protein of unknown function (DUF3311)